MNIKNIMNIKGTDSSKIKEYIFNALIVLAIIAILLNKFGFFTLFDKADPEKTYYYVKTNITLTDDCIGFVRKYDKYSKHYSSPVNVFFSMRRDGTNEMDDVQADLEYLAGKCVRSLKVKGYDFSELGYQKGLFSF